MKCQWCIKEANPDNHLPSGDIWTGNKELYYCDGCYKKVCKRLSTVFKAIREAWKE